MSTISPNMGLNIPTPNVTPGPDYATDLQESLNTLDTHDHSSGKGVAIGAAGLNLQADLSHNGYRITNAKSLILSNQIASLAATDARGIYCLNNDLYYVNGTTNVQITNGTSVAGANGTITGLVSPASAVYSAGQFEFYSTSATAANVYAKDYTLYNNSLATTVKLTQSAGSSYVYTLPAAVPSTSNAPLVMSTGGVTSASSAYTLTSAGIVPTTNAVSDLGSAPLRYSVLYVYAIEALGNANVSGNGIFGGYGSFSGTVSTPALSLITPGVTALDVATSNTTGYITFKNTGASASNNATLNFQFANELGWTQSFIGSGIQTDGSSNLQFVTTPAGARNAYRGVERVRITGTGDVGIGTTSPSYKLDVNGVVRAQSGLVTDNVYTDNVAVKHKKLTGTTNGSGSLIVAHGLTASKIMGVTGYIFSSGTYFGDYNISSFGVETSYTWNDIFLYFTISGLNTFFGSRPATVIVMYEA